MPQRIRVSTWISTHDFALLKSLMVYRTFIGSQSIHNRNNRGRFNEGFKIIAGIVNLKSGFGFA
ncbi:MAG: hypothetical protein LBJ77_01190 [Holosporales bacterium]|nr:hypothetical protein [Holosporales bacterium]